MSKPQITDSDLHALLDNELSQERLAEVETYIASRPLEAERIEHAMSAEMEERLVRVLGDPQTCPHGNPMPGAVPRPTRPLERLQPVNGRQEKLIWARTVALE